MGADGFYYKDENVVNTMTWSWTKDSKIKLGRINDSIFGLDAWELIPATKHPEWQYKRSSSKYSNMKMEPNGVIRLGAPNLEYGTEVPVPPISGWMCFDICSCDESHIGLKPHLHMRERASPDQEMKVISKSQV